MANCNINVNQHVQQRNRECHARHHHVRHRRRETCTVEEDDDDCSSTHSVSSDDSYTTSSETRRSNQEVQRTNASISAYMLHAEVHPKLSKRGRYPAAFARPRRIEWFLSLDSGTLIEICQVYDIPTTGYNLGYMDKAFGTFRRKTKEAWSEKWNENRKREYRMFNLFQYLGVNCADTDGGSSSKSGGRGNRGKGWGEV
ncbi:hypothetical protein WAI453_012129 [Rhynchosporium graminicola]|uniref:Uncharacterized protein n=1 Tax=Rhynchosporium graminicola TaxID=2792576 RepID=A0A1E1KX96_9HELO|nr:uncharacterized protein RCO7_05973 [Rhynchosporium commune]